MKRLLAFILLLLSVGLCGCAVVTSSIHESDTLETPPIHESNTVETLKGWMFQYNEGTNDYSVFFGLLNGEGQYISDDIDVDIRIVDESGNELYKATRSVSENDFGFYISQVAGERFLANIRIKESEIAEGVSSSGTVYLTVYKRDIFYFDEVNCKALYCLPVKEATVNVEQLPIELEVKGYDGKVESVIKIEDISYAFDNSLTPRLKITLFGIKISGDSSFGYDIISYKLYDSEEYVVTSGNVYLNSLGAGDKFKDDSVTIYDVIPGESYTLKLTEYNW